VHLIILTISQTEHTHNMGVLAAGIGKTQYSLPFFKTTLDAHSSAGQY
jgi:hypothetical protein